MYSRQPQRYRLSKRPPPEGLVSSSKRLKSTGEEFNLRNLTYYGDKMQTNDEIHQSIEGCPVMKALVDTQAFQRLRNIKQLGTSDYVFICANGNRFQHSLGVAHLAEKMCKTIKEEQPNLGATEKDVLCVKLAGLLHDIGHGPYSHLYEKFRTGALPTFLETYPDLKEEYKDCENLTVPEGWCHEQSSLQMVDAALEELGLQIDLNNLDKPLKQIGDGIDANSMRVFKPHGVDNGVLTSRDFVFIKECILGKPLEDVVKRFKRDGFIGRAQDHKEWLYDIVNNRHSGLDVDKIDYFARDYKRAIGDGSIDLKMVEDARVAKVRRDESGKYHYRICYPSKRIEAIMKFFKTRLHLHTIIYQHKKTVAVASMLCDILCLADPYFRLQSDKGEKYPISRAVVKSDYLLALDDNILRDIARSTDPQLEEARGLCRRLRKHDIYKCAVDQPLDIECDRHSNQMKVEEKFSQEAENCRLALQDSLRDKKVWDMDEEDIKQGMLSEKNFWTSHHGDENDESFPLEAIDFTVEKYYMHHGRKDKNPLSDVRFFDKMNEKLTGPIPDLPVAEPVDEKKYQSEIPLFFQKVGVRIFCRESRKRALVNQVFLQWFERMGRGEACEAVITPFPNLDLQLDDESDDDDDDEINDNFDAYPVMLSQESVDSDDEDEGGRANSQLDQSPIPVRSR